MKAPYKAYRDLLASPRWLKLAEAGARPQRLLRASTGIKDLAAPDTLYVGALAAPDTIETIQEKTLQAFADHGKVGAGQPADGGYAQALLDEFRREGVDDEALTARSMTFRHDFPGDVRQADYFCLASHLSNCAISLFWATMICLAMVFISGDLPCASCSSAIFKAC